MDASSQPDGPVVVILDDGYGDTRIEAEVLEPLGAAIVLRPCQGDAGAVRHAVEGANAVLVRESPVDRLAIAAMPGCKGIVRYGVGIDNIDRLAAAEAGIVVANVPDYGIDEVSDHALALLMVVGRRIVSRDKAVRAGAWNVSRAEPMHRFAGGTLGLIGAGRIGRLFAQKALGLGFQRVLVHDPYAPEVPDGWEQADPDRICREADAISLHAPLTPETHHIIDAARLASMKPTAILINTSRGGLIDTAALARVLEGGGILGAGLDVFETEPPDRSHPIFRAPNAVLTDHTGWYSEQSIRDLRRKAAEEIARILTDQDPRNPVAPPAGAATKHLEGTGT